MLSEIKKNLKRIRIALLINLFTINIVTLFMIMQENDLAGILWYVNIAAFVMFTIIEKYKGEETNERTRIRTTRTAN